MENVHTHDGISSSNGIEPILIAGAMLATICYMAAVVFSNRRLRKWPQYRTYCWCAGVWSLVLVLAGPLANRMHSDFPAHMLGHLLFGMVAPILMVLSAPATLLLRSLNRSIARRITYILKSRFFRFLLHPIIAAILNMGGLLALYTTRLFEVMHQNTMIYAAVHLHVFLSSYLFTASIIYIDPVAHRFTFKVRAVVLILVFAGHSILSKFIYASPPIGVSLEQAKAGAQLMYYGGDVVELLLIGTFCYQWYLQAYSSRRINGNLPAMVGGNDG